MIKALNHITLAVQDLERSFLFYKELIGLKPLVKWDQGAYFFIGEPHKNIPGSGLWFCLNVDKKREPSPCYTHYAFTVSQADFETVVHRLLDAKVSVFQENSSPGKSVYFLDPDGHKLEIHVGSAQERMSIKKKNSGQWKNIEWFV